MGKHIVKIEGPFDSTGKLVSSLEIGKNYSYIALPSEQMTPDELKSVNWSYQYDSGTIAVFKNAIISAENGNSKITCKFDQNSKTITVYAFKIKLSADISVKTNVVVPVVIPPIHSDSTTTAQIPRDDTFRTIANIVKHEAGTKDPKEFLWIAHTANNAAIASGKSLLGKLNTAYSSVPKINKVPLKDSDLSLEANYARDAVEDVYKGGDPTEGARFWDGTDFLAWGLHSPDGTPQNKFEEYKSITIPKNIYDVFLAKQLEKYSQHKVKYGTKIFDLPATVFTAPANRKPNGDFYYLTNARNATRHLVATGTAGRSIFWKTV